jgi:neutral trehalase
MKKSEDALEQLWDGYSGQYYSRNFATHKLIKEPSIATLMPLYAGCISKERAEQLVSLIHDKHKFGALYPVPTVPLDSPWFKDHGYWQGPTWLNTNWLIIDGLRRYGYKQEADIIAAKSIELVEKSGCYEYFSPIDGSRAGARNFSWTAALTIDLLSS